MMTFSTSTKVAGRLLGLVTRGDIVKATLNGAGR